MMTEAEWLASIEPRRMFAWLGGRLTTRQRHHFTHACGCRDCLVWPRERYNDEREASFWLERKPRVDELCAKAIEAASDQCDGVDRAQDLESFRNEVFGFGPLGLVWDLTASVTGDIEYWVLRRFPELPATAEEQASLDGALLWRAHAVACFQADLFRELVRNPFRPVARGLRWLTVDTQSLGWAAYHARLRPSGHLDNARLAVLSDALEEAGCTDEAILHHLRSPGPHVRGCWVLDLVLGKS
jgi:hypothetical protein